jgi:UDP-N-acetylmuramate--alanine ligase
MPKTKEVIKEIRKNINLLKTMIKKDELLALLQNKTFEVLVTIGAGDIDKYLTPISNLLKSRQ